MPELIWKRRISSTFVHVAVTPSPASSYADDSKYVRFAVHLVLRYEV
jgi:hypothetical protein